MPAAGITQAQLAERLGVSRRTVSEILHEYRPVTTDVAHRLARVFRTTPAFWLRLQEAVDIWDAFQARKNEYRQIRPLRETACSPEN